MDHITPTTQTTPTTQITPTTEAVLRSDTVHATAAAALHGLLDGPGSAPTTGDAVPPLWHWLSFLPRAAQADLGPDGHPAADEVLPPAPLPKRMYAGGRFEFLREIPLGAEVHRGSRVTSVVEKSGRSGTLVFVTLRHELALSDGELCVVEEQDLVYREASSAPGPALPEPGEIPGDWDLSWDLEIDPTLLFRFSALTYNAHRIHYDRAYATEVEGYPGLVVHGPLQAVALAELCRRHVERPLVAFEFRAGRPVFDHGPLRIRGRVEGDTVHLCTFDLGGNVAVQADATLA